MLHRAIIVVIITVISACGGVGTESSGTKKGAERTTTSGLNEGLSLSSSKTDDTPATSVVVTPEKASLVFAATFESLKPKLLEILKRSSSVEAVRGFDYDSNAKVVALDIASGFVGGNEYRFLFDGQAWELTQGLAGALWYSETVKILQGHLPAFRLVLDQKFKYECSPEVMIKIGDKALGREDWERSCVR